MRKVNEWRETEDGSMIHINHWILEGWHEKALYILGFVWVALYMLWFVAAYIGNLAN